MMTNWSTKGFERVKRIHRAGSSGVHEGIGFIQGTDGQFRIQVPKVWRDQVSTRQTVHAELLISEDRSEVMISLSTMKGEDTRIVSKSGTIAATPLASYMPGITPGFERATFALVRQSDDGRSAVFRVPESLRRSGI